MALTVPDTGRITLTLTTRTIKALRLLALLKDETQNEVAEALLIDGGLHNAVDSQWRAEQPADAPVSLPEPPSPQMPSVLPAPPQKPAAAPAAPSLAPQVIRPVTPQAAPIPVQPASPRDGWMPEVPKVTDDDEPSPYKF